MFKPTVILTVLMLALSAPAWSDEADEMKQKALETCKTPAVLTTGYDKIVAVENCNCIVDHTDYTVVIEGNKDNIQEDAKKSALACAMKGAM